MTILSRARLFAAGVLALALTLTPAATAGAATSSAAGSSAGCSTPWGSLPKTSSAATTEAITNVRSGRHACFDRLVVDLGPAGVGRAGYDVRYVSNVYQDGSGALVPLRGGAKIQLVVKAPAYNMSTGLPTFVPVNKREVVNVTGYSTFRQVAWAGSFEGQTTLGVGVRARTPMRVFVLDGPGAGHRLVLDVAHSW